MIDITGGTFEGARLRGMVHPTGGDWLLLGPDGLGRLDVRLTLETDDGALIYLQYFGILEWTEELQKAIESGGSTEYKQVYYFTQPRFETGNNRYAWLNGVVGVGRGRARPNAVEYEVFQVVQE